MGKEGAGLVLREADGSGLSPVHMVPDRGRGAWLFDHGDRYAREDGTRMGCGGLGNQGVAREQKKIEPAGLDLRRH